MITEIHSYQGRCLIKVLLLEQTFPNITIIQLENKALVSAYDTVCNTMNSPIVQKGSTDQNSIFTTSYFATSQILSLCTAERNSNILLRHMRNKRGSNRSAFRDGSVLQDVVGVDDQDNVSL